MAEEQQPPKEPTLIERWLEEQTQWQKTTLAYLDSMAKNEDFLVNLGNAMRGSLLAGKPYPTPPATSDTPTEENQDDRLDQVLFALHQIQGQLEDLRMTVDELLEQQAQAASNNNNEKTA